ncbi:hypothetical protein NK718_09180 [Alsobacter sp. SYSU M60028]|uniref:Sulfur globule protein n=1 Tax=Alsobacter ponti TaxID=2962936 RepID=A0ABT1LB22_9HYPH|nr:hypothetical protein [Alsobacter ponti]MCP8938685.1 hypothetical protein [Alsobacter ponti]
MTMFRLTPVRTALFAALAGSGLLAAAPADAAPAARGPSIETAPLVQAQWGGPPYGRAYGYRRHHSDYGYRPWRHGCRTVYHRRWSPWRGGWVMQPVRRCW